MKKLVTVMLALVMSMSLLLAGCGSSSESTENTEEETEVEDDGEETADDSEETSEIVASDVKVALLLVGAINDYGWSQAGYEGVSEAAEEYGFEFAYSESVALAEMETTLRDYASQGYDLIIAHGDEFSDAVCTVAEEFPDCSFAISNGAPTTELDNVIGMDIRNEEQGYIAGYALGLLTESGKVGFIGSVEGTSQKRVENGLTQGLAASNPDAEVMISYVGSYSDMAAAKEQATAMIEQGADVLFQYAQGAGIGVVQAAAEEGVKIVVTTPSQAEMAEGYAAFAVQTVNKDLVKMLIDSYMDGEFGPDLVIEGTFATNLFQINSIDNDVISEEVMAEIQEQADALADGSLVLETRQLD
ncbi:MAG: BMP family protein [Lachnospiraceae bacterium]|nr:BMP family protein [Lachnospiraceae bacterium]